MNIDKDVRLSSLTTLGVGGSAKQLITVDTEAELIAAVVDADENSRSVLLIGGGSNLVVSDDRFDGDVVRIATQGIDVVDASDCAGVTVTVAAGEPWDDLVAQAVTQGWAGVEALSGIPGLTGATPIQNVGAYGQEVSQTIAQVRVYDRMTKEVTTVAATDCGFGYRMSRFKHDPRWIVLSATFQFRAGTLGSPIAYAELARALDVTEGERAPLADVRDAVLALRRSKAMVIDVDDPDTRSAGSFFTNPVLSVAAADALPAEAPRWTHTDGRIKTSAAWLIEQAGFVKGYRLDSAGLSSKHTLAITTSSPAKAEDVITLARHIRSTVFDRFGIHLVAEPVLVGFPDDVLGQDMA